MTMHTALSAFSRPALAAALSAACLLALALPRPAQADAAGDGHRHPAADAAPQAKAGDAEAAADHNEDKITLNAEQIQAAGLGIETAGPAKLETASRFPGEIRFNEDRTAHVVPRLAGVVQEVSADLGQQVKKGELLAVISSPQLSELRSELAAAQRRLSLAAATHQRELKLWREKVSAEQDYQQARTALQEAQIAVQNAAQKLAAIGAPPQSNDLSRLRAARAVRRRGGGEAPRPGRAGGRHRQRLHAVRPAHRLGGVRDRAQGPAGRARGRGRQRRLRGVLGPRQGRGPVSYIGELLGEQTRTATARVTLGNPDSTWRPGLFVSVNVVTSSADAAVVVAADAVQTVENESVVYVEVPDGFVAQPVKLGSATGEQVEVLSGLAAGTRYVARNGSFVLKSELGKGSAPATRTEPEHADMFERIIRFAIEQRWLVLLAVLGMAGLGVCSYTRSCPSTRCPTSPTCRCRSTPARRATRRWRPSSASPTRWRPSWPACPACSRPARCRATGCRR